MLTAKLNVPKDASDAAYADVCFGACHVEDKGKVWPALLGLGTKISVADIDGLMILKLYEHQTSYRLQVWCSYNFNIRLMFKLKHQMFNSLYGEKRDCNRDNKYKIRTRTDVLKMTFLRDVLHMRKTFRKRFCGG